MHAAEAQVVGMGRIVGGIASIVSFFFFSFFLFLFLYPAVRACWREGGGDPSETERERERDGIMNNEY